MIQKPASRTFGARSRLLAVAALLLGLAGVATPTEALESGPHGKARKKKVVFTVDIAENGSKFVPGPPLDGSGFPLRGSFFIAEGFVFPAGTIEGDGTEFDPTTTEGSIGLWFCRGTHVVDGALFADSRYGADTTQAYLLPDDGEMITTEGLEGGIGVAITRAVTGGSGKYENYIGVQKQELLGFNATNGVNLRVTFELTRVAR